MAAISWPRRIFEGGKPASLAGCTCSEGKPLRVVIPTVSLHIGGGCRFLAELANGLTEERVDVTMVVPNGQPISYDVHGRVVRVPFLAAEYLPPADIALPNYWTTVDAAYRVYGRRCIRLALSFEPLFIPEWEAAAATYQLPIPILAISNWLSDTLAAGIGTRPWGIVHAGVDGRVFRPAGRQPPLSGQKPPVVFGIIRPAARGYALKGSADFWQAMSYAQARHPELDVQVVTPDGSGDETSVRHRREVADVDEEMAELYRTADLFVGTSWFEALSLPVLEAMACGTPVITTDAGGVRELIETGRSGLIVPARSPEAVALAIELLLARPELARTMANNALETAQAWTWHDLGPAVHSFLHQHMRAIA